MAACNWGLTQYRIGNNWKLENWNDKTESKSTKMKKKKTEKLGAGGWVNPPPPLKKPKKKKGTSFIVLYCM